MALIPKVLKNFNLVVRGQGFAGIVDEVTLPHLKIKEEEHRAGGMDAPAPIDMGMDKLELKFMLAEHHSTVYGGFGIISGRAVDLIFRGAKVGDGAVVEPMIIEARGMYSEIEGAKVKAGDKDSMSATVSLDYYKLTMNGVVLIEIDIKNMIRRINGDDQLAAIRAAIDV